MASRKPIGVILTETTTRNAKCQLYEQAERGKVSEGKFLLIESSGRKILCRIGSLLPQNEFYTPGDAWTEARRKRWSIPQQVARRYEISDLDLLGEMGGGGGLKEISIPPYPGDEVFEIKIPEDMSTIFGVDQKEPGIIWYGSLIGYEKAPTPLTIENLPMHMAIFGVTGSGKSYSMGALIEKLALIKKGENKYFSFPMLIIDANGDYLDYVDYFIENEEFGATSNITRYVFPNSPDAKVKKECVEPVGVSLNHLLEHDLAELIVQYYTGGQKNELQITGIEQVIERMESEGDIEKGDHQRIFMDDSVFKKALTRLDKLKGEQTIHYTTASAIRRGLEKFKKDIEDDNRLLSTKPQLDYDFIDRITKNREIAIIDFSVSGAPGVSPRLKQILVAYLSSILLQRFTEYKISEELGERYLLFIMEEAQNYCPNLKEYDIGYSLAREKLAHIATQGRKFGLCLCLISQRPSFVDQTVLSMCNTFFVHRISERDVSYVRRVTGGLSLSLDRKLTTLDQGNAVAAGQLIKFPFPLLIKIPPRLVPATRGKTRVLESFKV